MPTTNFSIINNAVERLGRWAIGGTLSQYAVSGEYNILRAKITGSRIQMRVYGLDDDPANCKFDVTIDGVTTTKTFIDFGVASKTHLYIEPLPATTDATRLIQYSNFYNMYIWTDECFVVDGTSPAIAAPDDAGSIAKMGNAPENSNVYNSTSLWGRISTSGRDNAVQANIGQEGFLDIKVIPSGAGGPGTIELTGYGQQYYRFAINGVPNPAHIQCSLPSGQFGNMTLATGLTVPAEGLLLTVSGGVIGNIVVDVIGKGGAAIYKGGTPPPNRDYIAFSSDSTGYGYSGQTSGDASFSEASYFALKHGFAVCNTSQGGSLMTNTGPSGKIPAQVSAIAIPFFAALGLSPIFYFIRGGQNNPWPDATYQPSYQSMDEEIYDNWPACHIVNDGMIRSNGLTLDDIAKDTAAEAALNAAKISRPGLIGTFVSQASTGLTDADYPGLPTDGVHQGETAMFKQFTTTDSVLFPSAPTSGTSEFNRNSFYHRYKGLLNG